MKTFITALLLSIFSLSYSQDYKVNIATGTYGINPKIRLQIELPLKRFISYGVMGSYYLEEARGMGPAVTAFGRIYPAKNKQGFFIQAKYEYASFDGQINEFVDEFSFNSSGYGIGLGRKGLLFGHLTWEPYIGFKNMTGPEVEDFIEGTSKYNGWKNWTGSMFDFQFKIGLQI